MFNVPWKISLRYLGIVGAIASCSPISSSVADSASTQTKITTENFEPSPIEIIPADP